MRSIAAGIEMYEMSNERVARAEMKSARANGYTTGSHHVVRLLEQHTGFNGSMSPHGSFLLGMEVGFSVCVFSMFL